jgi:small subunit ribosomal protein S6
MYVDFLKKGNCEIIHLEEKGILQLAYPIGKKTSGAYFWVEYNAAIGSDVINKMELAFRRDDTILRYLTIKVDKHRAQFNIDKRAGKFIKKDKDDEDANASGAKENNETNKLPKAKVEG